MKKKYNPIEVQSVADPGFPVGGGVDLVRGGVDENFVCQNERIGTRGGARAGRASLDPPMSVA